MTIQKAFQVGQSADALSVRAIHLHLRQKHVEGASEADGSVIPLKIAAIDHRLHALHGKKPKPFTALV